LHVSKSKSTPWNGKWSGSDRFEERVAGWVVADGGEDFDDESAPKRGS